jgi:hypothetical protein
MYAARARATGAAGRLCGDPARRGRWLRVITGLAIVAVVAGLGAQLSHAVARAAAEQPTAGMLSVSPPSVTAGNPATTFTLDFAPSMVFLKGTLTWTVPAGWPDPQTSAPGNPGFTSCILPCSVMVGAAGNTIVITGIVAKLGGTIGVSYLATAPAPAAPPSEDDAFTAVATLSSTSATFSTVPAAVTVMSIVVVSTSPPTSPATSSVATSPATSPATSSVATSPATSPINGHGGRGGPGSQVPIAPVLGSAVAAIAVLLLGVRLVRRRSALVAGQSVRAVPQAGQPARTSVHATGPDVTLTVRIEPQPSGTDTTIRGVEEPQEAQP